MGSAISCSKCPTVETGSVINLSDPLILRLTEGVEVPGPKIYVAPEDEFWIEKLQCIDDSHTKIYGLTFKNISDLTRNLEAYLRDTAPINYCPVDVVKGCFMFNQNAPLNCTSEVEEFINCIDAKRKEKLKILQSKADQQKIELERLKKKSELNNKLKLPQN